ncbi:RNA-directed RNA polymerase [Saccharata proteae CBS 121410]|uniref:RNA-dependent RNA polymerase n=1 Tax=Saccharata proteae CBS 121410 TaxID=1314787 RepID=A0A9P4HT30_9PEZI|nr:RNA-directed RNA polymerase [Saccharata proteae CBS 121410]
MDIQVRNLQVQVTSKALSEYLSPYLEQLQIFTFDVNKIKNRTFAIITIPDVGKAEKFLKLYGEKEGGGRATVRLDWFLKPLYFRRGLNKPDEATIRCLQREDKLEHEKRKKRQQEKIVQHKRQGTGDSKTFDVSWLRCGVWDYQGPHAGFVPYFQDLRRGAIKFGKTSLTLLLFQAPVESSWVPHRPDFRIDIPYWTIDHIVTGDYDEPLVTLSLTVAPKFYEIPEQLDFQMSALGLGPSKRVPKRWRVTSLEKTHEAMVGSCLVYQINLASRMDIQRLLHMFQTNPGMPAYIPHRLVSIQAESPFKSEMKNLKEILLSGRKYGHFPFPIRFQLERLATNAFLPPNKVVQLLPVVDALYKAGGESPGVVTMRVAEAIRMLGKQMGYPGPQEDANSFQVGHLGKLLRDNAKQWREEGSLYDLNARHEHVVLVHKAVVTPAGVYLEGPAVEVTNRVLRKYSKNIEYFIRVTFSDEDGESVRFDPNANLERIYRGRFKNVMEHGLNIAGHTYQFLGFSHSSLRSQTCWFMAPFVQNGSLMAAENVIKELGEFSSIRSPARCAARIGQAFSDTNGKVTIDPDRSLDPMEDVERNGRTFSDGVGTISLRLLKRVWHEYALSQKLKPTCLQIRFGGAKGMVSLDTRLKDEKLILRRSMVKFYSKDIRDIEICNSNIKSLPMYLNRQFIKILEDLGTDPKVIINLQASAVETLRRVTTSPVNAANYLEAHHIGKAARIPSLIRMLEDIGLTFNDDDFLERVVEIAALAQLRDLKHRARIPVADGVTLFGIMDESNYLKEGQIFCIMGDPNTGRRRVIVGKQVIVTRAPALHPGDVQVVEAVKIPPGSMVNSLNNCVVFSQQGERDLPSMLSGGDLDGDLYNVIYNRDLLPKFTCEAADYPRMEPIDIGREVNRRDMTDFFIKFMETDRLGQISTIHLQLADLRNEGTRHPDCIKLAGMASTAVDFSKTGIPVDMSEAPRYNSLARPDFMAPGPRVFIEKKGNVFEEDEDDDDDGEDEVSALDPDFKRRRYYESDKVLGHLYRAIDERSFFDAMHKSSEAVKFAPNQDIMDLVWTYVQEETLLVQWRHYIPLARDIKETYESNLFDIMSDYSVHPKHPLKEVEVFCGTIIGKTGGQPKHVRDAAMDMKDRFERDVTFTIERITQGDDGDKHEALARSIACMYTAFEEVADRRGYYKKFDELKSWRYVAAAVCLKEVEGFQGPYGPLKRGFYEDEYE